MKESRLSRRLEKQTKKNIFITIAGIFIILFLLAKFAIPLISSATLFIINSKNPNQSNANTNLVSFVAPPQLDPIPEATNSAKINVSGIAEAKQTIKLYINDELVDKQEVDKDNRFIFKEVKINSGDNAVKVKAVTEDKKESSFSPEVTVAYKNNPLTLTLDSPSDNQSFSKDDKFAQVSGKTDPSAKVTVNDFWAIVGYDGKFSYQFPLQSGENKIKVVATDDAGNKTEVERKVTYSP